MAINVTFNDVQSVTSTRTFTDEGFLIADANLSRVSTVPYLVSDFAKGTFPRKADSDTVRVFRGADVLFSEATLNSFSGKPVTNGHPVGGAVTPVNARAVQVGHIGDAVKADGQMMTARLTLTDQNSIELAKSTPISLSVGYRGELEVGSGTAPNGEQFDAKLVKMVGNHVALTDSPRAGNSCRILDSNDYQNEEINTMPKVKINGIEVEVNEEAHSAVNTLIDSKEDLQSQLTDKTSEVEKLLGKIVALETTLADEDAFVKRVQHHVNLITDAKSVISDFTYEGKSSRDIQIEVIKTLNDSFDSEGKSDEFINGAFMSMVDAHQRKTATNRDTFAGAAIMGDALKSGDTGAGLAAKGRDAFRARSAKAYLGAVKS